MESEYVRINYIAVTVVATQIQK